jgi:hypothetical protein
MPSTAAALHNGLNLAYWLYRIHPNLFAALQGPANQYRAGRKLSRFGALRALGDDVAISSTDIGTTTTFDTGGISPDLITMADPGLTDVNISIPDVSAISNDVSSAISAGAPSISLPVTSPGNTGTVTSALSSVGSFLASATGLTALTNLGTAYFKSNTPQGATLNTQIGRVQAGVTPAPITYGYNAQGQLVPVLSQAGLNTPLTPSTLNSLLPSGLARYALPIGLGLLALWAFASRK